MNSAPSSRYRTASDPITPTSETALEMGWRWITTLIPQTTAMMAKIRNRMTSISTFPGHQKTGDQQVGHGHREENAPGEAHELVVTEPRQRATDPDEGEQQDSGFRSEPEQRQHDWLRRRQEKQQSHAEEYQRDYGQRVAV